MRLQKRLDGSFVNGTDWKARLQSAAHLPPLAGLGGPSIVVLSIDTQETPNNLEGQGQPAACLQQFFLQITQRQLLQLVRIKPMSPPKQDASRDCAQGVHEVGVQGSSSLHSNRTRLSGMEEEVSGCHHHD